MPELMRRGEWSAFRFACRLDSIGYNTVRNNVRCTVHNGRLQRRDAELYFRRTVMMPTTMPTRRMAAEQASEAVVTSVLTKYHPCVLLFQTVLPTLCAPPIPIDRY